MIKRSSLLALTLALVLTLAACGSSGGSDSSKSSDDKSSSEDSGGSKDDDGGSGGDCGSQDGEAGVIRSFCDGPAEVSFSGPVKGTIGGGTCEDSMGYYSVNAGTVVGPDFTGTPPDYAGFNFPADATSYSGNDASGSVTYDGETYVIQEISGERNGDDITFSGSVFNSDEEMEVTIKC